MRNRFFVGNWNEDSNWNQRIGRKFASRLYAADKMAAPLRGS